MGTCPSRHVEAGDVMAAGSAVGDEETPLDTCVAAGSHVQHLAVSALNGERMRVRENVFSGVELEELLRAVRSSPYFGENAGENDFYRGTRGFHVKFRDTYRHAVEEHLPFLKPVLARTLRSECNSFFLNVFEARRDGQDYHTDNYFTSYCGSYRPTDLVTVAYLGAPEAMVGGELVVLNGSIEELGRPPRRGAEDAGGSAAQVLRRVRPQPGLVVDFDGRLLHAVHAFDSPEPRVSLVIEQCKLARRHFAKTPRFNIDCQRTNTDLQIV